MVSKALISHESQWEINMGHNYYIYNIWAINKVRLSCLVRASFMCWSLQQSKIEFSNIGKAFAWVLKGCSPHLTKGHEGKWFRVSRGHAWWFEDHDHEISTTLLYNLGHRTAYKANLHYDVVFLMNIKINKNTKRNKMGDWREGQCQSLVLAWMRGASPWS